MSIVNIRSAYREIEVRDGLQRDPAQQSLLDELQDLQEQLVTGTRTWRSRLRGLGLPVPLSGRHVRGLYIWGSVGRGKTFMMDLFYNSLALRRKRRIHFHRMMSEVHQRLKSHNDTTDPIDAVSADLAKDISVLCFDEFFVSDIGDAMILGRLLEGLFRRGVTLVATSNSAPADLYSGGLQRERFLPAIASLEQHTRVVHMEGDNDYRLRLLQKAGTYLTPDDSAADEKLRHFFREIAPGGSTENRQLDILGRTVRTVRCAKGVAWFAFPEICEGPRSQQDYIEIARWYQTVIVAGVPALGADCDDAARRFVAMVDEFYDRKVKLILSAAVPLDELYCGQRLAFEFRRTYSRLTEMQSTDYLHTAHIA